MTSFGINIYVVKIVIDRKLKIKCCRRQWIFEHRYADGCGGVTNGGTESSQSLSLSGPTGPRAVRPKKRGNVRGTCGRMMDSK